MKTVSTGGSIGWYSCSNCRYQQRRADLPKKPMNVHSVEYNFCTYHNERVKFNDTCEHHTKYRRIGFLNRWFPGDV